MGDEEDILAIPDPAKRLEALEAAERRRRRRAARRKREARARDEARLELSLLYERSVFEGKRALWLSSLYCDPDIEAMKVTIATGVSDSKVAK